MSHHQHAVRGRYFEDFTVGEDLVTSGRTVTSTDIVNFACISGDFNEIHTNFEYCKSTPFGEPIAHGPLIYAIAGGLWHSAGYNEGTILAMLGVEDWRLVSPVKHGDTIHLEAHVASKRETSKPDRGVVAFDRRIVKQDGTVAQTMRVTLMYRRRPTA
ncbi:MAG: acyl dehydratase [Rhodoferax sp.]|nr:acyl dehydratase [Rhodoferax sp.]